MASGEPNLLFSTTKTTKFVAKRLVENFSPSCGHCRAFLPTWKQLVADVEGVTDPGITLAQMNCGVFGDFCSEIKIGYYPQINLYRNGDLVETYSGTRDLDKLQEYVEKHAEPTTPKPVATSTAPPIVVAPTATKAVEVLHVQTPRADVNTAGAVLPLNPNNFQEVLAQGPVFVKFFAPWYVPILSLSRDLLTFVWQVWSLQETRSCLGPARSAFEEQTYHRGSQLRRPPGIVQD